MQDDDVVHLQLLLRLDDDASDDGVEPLTLVRQLAELVRLPAKHLRTQTLRTSPVSHPARQRVALRHLRRGGRRDARGPAFRGQVLREGSVQRRRHVQLLHQRSRHLLLEKHCRRGF